MKTINTFLLAISLFGSTISAQEMVKTEFGVPVSQQLKEHVRTCVPTREVSTVTPIPAPGLVSSIKKIEVIFVGASIVNTSDAHPPKLLKADGSVIYCSDTKVSNNSIIITFNPEITEEGTYTLNIPRLGVTVDYSSLDSDINLVYTIGTSSDNGIIRQAPEGTTVKCQSDFLSYFVVDNGLSGMPLAGKPLHYVIGNDGNLYLYNIITLQPYGGQQTSSYIVGTPSGENTWKFSFPQPIYENVENGKQEIWYLNYLYTYVDPETQSASYLPYEQDNSVQFMIDEDGNAVWLSGNEDPEVDNGFAIGASRPDGTWTGFANVNRCIYQKFTLEAPEIDSNEYEIWKLTTGPHNQRTSRNVNVYIDGNDIWIKGFSKTYLPNAWAHGVINGKTITFDPFIGECEPIGQYLFLYGYTDSKGRTDLTFKYYPEEKGMTCNSEYIINPNQFFYYACEVYEYPSLEFIGSGINEINSDAVVSEEWYSLDGIRVDNPSKGIFIRRSILDSGKTEYSKIVIE